MKKVKNRRCAVAGLCNPLIAKLLSRDGTRFLSRDRGERSTANYATSNRRIQMPNLKSSCCLTATLFLALAWPSAAQNPAGRLRAGAAKVDITPRPSDLLISTDSIRDHLFVRAIAVDDGATCAVLVGMDLGGASNQIVDDATPRASRSTGCPAQNFLISATHTHSSNTGGLGGRGAP